ncbi:MAG: hypothetical protein FWB78_08895 [Treponema sp.]|nr:hypothetical protein [Treponema sp.]
MMDKAKWGRLKALVCQYRHGRISRSRFVLEWRMAQPGENNQERDKRGHKEEKR